MNKVKGKIKNPKAITLISLIVTIIILIILAGITISLTVGSNGIITRAREARNLYINKQEEEQARINVLEREMNSINEDIKIEEITLNKNETEIIAENEEKLIVTIKPNNANNKKITWTSSNSEVATVDSNGKIIAKKEGSTIITAKTNDGSNKQEICAVKVIKKVNVSRGAFVEYNVAYTDMYNSNNKYTATNGWRLLDYTKNADGTYSNVKLISTGVPVRLYYCYSDTTNNSWYVKDSEQLANFKNVLGSGYQYYTGTHTYNSLQASAGLYYNFKDIKFAYGASDRGKSLGWLTEITSNGTTYNSSNTTETTGSNLFIPTGVNASVRLMTLSEMNTMLGRTDIDSLTTMTDPTGADGLFVLQNIKNITGMSAYTYSNTGYYWLASPYPASNSYDGICNANYKGNVSDVSIDDDGVRPVVCLTSNIQFTDNENGVLKFFTHS